MIENRILRAIRAIVAELTAPYAYHGIYRYRVVSQILNKFVLQALSKNVPDLVPCRARPGLPGAKAALTPGSEVLVAFEDGDSQKPVIISYADAGDEGFKPTSIEIGADVEILLGSGGAYVLRDGDTISITPGNGSGVVAGVITVTSPTAGIPKVKA